MKVTQAWIVNNTVRRTKLNEVKVRRTFQSSVSFLKKSISYSISIFCWSNEYLYYHIAVVPGQGSVVSVTDVRVKCRRRRTRRIRTKPLSPLCSASLFDLTKAKGKTFIWTKANCLVPQILWVILRLYWSPLPASPLNMFAMINGLLGMWKINQNAP